MNNKNAVSKKRTTRNKSKHAMLACYIKAAKDTEKRYKIQSLPESEAAGNKKQVRECCLHTQSETLQQFYVIFYK